jgi:predicted amidohydrolase
MIVAGVQFDIAWENPAENFRRADALIDRAAEGGARLVVLPEMFATGFSMRAEEVAVHADETREFIAQRAVRHDLWMLAGYAEAGERRPFNSASLVGPDGREVLHYRKIHPFSLAGEDEHFDAGESMKTADLEGLRVTPVICYDLRFPEIFRAVAERTDLFVVIANWPDRRSFAWRVLLQARAIDCQAWFLGVNRVGRAQGHDHRGDSALVDPMGEVVASLAWEEGVVAGEVDPDRVRRLREELGFLADRRPDLYSEL